MAEALAESQFGEEVDEAEYGTSAEYVDPWCDLCYDDTGDMVQAYGFCPECNAFICRTCHGNHRKWPTLKTHKILSRSKMPKSQAEKPVKYPVCTRHAGNVRDHYCIDHSEMICNECIKPTHQSCSATPVSVICQSLGSADIQQFETTVDTLKQSVLSTKSALESNVIEIENQKDDLIKQAKEERDKLISRAGELYENTVSIVSDACEKKNAYITEQVRALDDIIQSLDETNTDINKTLNIKFDQNVFIRMQRIVEEVSSYRDEIKNMNKDIKKIILSFSPSSEISTFLSVSEYLGDITEISSQLDDNQSLPETVFPQASALTRMTGTSESQDDISQITDLRNVTLAFTDSCLIKLSSLDISLKQDKYKCYTEGIAVTEKGVLLVSDGSNKSVKAFSWDNKLLSCLTLSACPYDISVINDQTAAVSTEDRKLHISNISNPANISIDRSVSLGYCVFGVTHYKGNLIVTSLSVPGSVKMIDLNGREQWSVSVDDKGQQLFDTPYAVTVTTSNDTSTVIVSDRGKHSLTVLDPNDGHLIKTVDVKGKQPYGLTTDKNGNVYVCYCNTKEICVFSPDFEKSRILLSSSELRGSPRHIVYCSNSDVLYIAYGYGDSVECFQLSQGE